ncbi:hypothetical protein Ancab_030958 [Ancistrocladus abbreviatus]
MGCCGPRANFHLVNGATEASILDDVGGFVRLSCWVTILKGCGLDLDLDLGLGQRAMQLERVTCEACASVYTGRFGEMDMSLCD